MADWFDEQVQGTSSATPEGLPAAIAQIYQTALGRAPENDQVVQQWIAGTGGDLAKIQQGIYATPEAQNYSYAQTHYGKTPGQTPVTPNLTPQGGDVRSFIASLAQMPGADPSLANDPDYWVNAINSRGGLTDANRQYWQDAAVGSTAFFNNPNRESGGSASTSSTTGAAPTFTAPAYEKPPAFSYADFVAPDPSQLASDPWTQYTLKTQQDAIQKSAAARGMLQTGGTINDLLTNASAINSQGYQNLWNNAQQTYATNRGNAVDAYNTNYGTQYSDPYHYQYQGAQDTYNAAAHAYDQGQMYDWNQTLFGEQQAQDQWANKFKLLGLI